MSTSSPWAFPSIITQDNSGVTWSSVTPSDFATADGNIALAFLTLSASSLFLHFTGFDFDSILPGGAMPSGIELQLQEWYSDGVDGTISHAGQSPRIKVAGPAVRGLAKSRALPDTSTLVTYGGAGDDWDLLSESAVSLTRALVADSAFGIRIRSKEDGVGTAQSNLDMVRMRIHYQDEITVNFPISSSSFDQESVDTSIADYRATRVVNNLVNSAVTRVQWEFRENGGTRFSHFTNSGGDEVGTANILRSGLNFLDLWLPPSAPYTVRTREFTNSWGWGAWNGVNSFTALGLINSFEKYQILNRGTKTET